jgi:hypothetical protein
MVDPWLSRVYDDNGQVRPSPRPWRRWVWLTFACLVASGAFVWIVVSLSMCQAGAPS